MTTRRSFLAGIFATGFAPAICHAGILMPVRKLEVPEFGISYLEVLSQAVDDDIQRLKNALMRTATDGHGGYALYLPPDPELEKEEFVRQLTERRSPQPGESPPMVGEIGSIETIRFMTTATLR